MKSIGLYFGSFNPVTNAHMTVATDASDYKLDGEFIFDEVWFIVSPHNPHKNTKDLAEFDHRVQMVKSAIEESKNEKLHVSDIEGKLITPSYTYNTLEALEDEHFEYKFSIICGTDTYLTVNTWKNGRYILDEYDFFVVKRGDVNFVRYKGTDIISELGSTMSATLVRDRVATGRSIDFMVPSEIRKYIYSNKLYK